MDHSTPGRQLFVGDSIRFRLARICSRTARNGKPTKDPWTTVLEVTGKFPGPTRGRGRSKITELFADERCSQAILDFLATTDVERKAGHRRKKTQEQRPARPRGGTVGDAKGGSQERESGSGWRNRRAFILSSFTLYFRKSMAFIDYRVVICFIIPFNARPQYDKLQSTQLHDSDKSPTHEPETPRSLLQKP